MKSWWITVLEDGKTTVFQKECLTVKEARELEKAKTEEFPKPKYKVLREWY
jgi:hypothetical protein